MAEYIEREKVIEHLLSMANASEKLNGGIMTAIYQIKAQPAADVRPERHGRWIPDGDCVVCSECGEEHCWEDYRASYCEDCGAKMDGKE